MAVLLVLAALLGLVTTAGLLLWLRTHRSRIHATRSSQPPYQVHSADVRGRWFVTQHEHDVLGESPLLHTDHD